jgi:hypothetical protein
MKKFLITVAGIAALGAAMQAPAQTPNAVDEAQVLISQIQTDKRKVVLQTLALTDAQVAAFTPIYDQYQVEMKALFERQAAVLDKFAANFGAMTDEAARSILKESLSIRDDRNALMRKYAKKFDKVLPSTKVLQWAQVENKLNTLLDMQAAAVVPIAR